MDCAIRSIRKRKEGENHVSRFRGILSVCMLVVTDLGLGSLLFMTTDADFTIKGLCRLLNGFRDHGYEFALFDDGPCPDHGKVLLRHDVDFDLNAAVEVAELEADLGISATFFVLVTSDLYNVYGRTGRAQLRRLVSLGHRIGLHFDASLYQRMSSIEDAIVTEAEILRAVAEVSIGTFSTHRPGSLLDCRVPSSVGGMTNTYSRPLIEEIAYSSDSTGWWRFGQFMDSEDWNQLRSVQLLLHPVWWTSTAVEHPGHRLERLALSKLEDIRSRIGTEIPAFAAWQNSSNGAPIWPDLAVMRYARRL